MRLHATISYIQLKFKKLTIKISSIFVGRHVNRSFPKSKFHLLGVNGQLNYFSNSKLIISLQIFRDLLVKDILCILLGML